MMQYLKLSITFLHGTYHGMVDAGEAEWPPSPMRVYQALVATAARKFGEALPSEVSRALDWLAGLEPPSIQAPPCSRAMPVRASVPNNAMDICARAWSRGSYDAKDAKPSTHKAMKTIAPVRLLEEDASKQRVCYFWELADDTNPSSHCEVISKLASQLVCVGWGVDLVAGHAEVVESVDGDLMLSDSRNGEIWLPGQSHTRRLRVANSHTRKALTVRHQRFLGRLADGALDSVPAVPPSAYETVGYGRPWDATTYAIAAFSLIEPDGSRFVRFPTSKGTELVGMLRSALSSAAEIAGWHERKIASVVLGHGEQRGESHQSIGLNRFAYVPLPSLEPRASGGPADHVGLIRRVLIYSPSNILTRELDWVRRALSGLELIDERTKLPVAILSSIPSSDKMVDRFTKTSASSSAGASTWSTVTPVVLPRNYMRRQDVQKIKSAPDSATKQRLYLECGEKIDGLLRMAIKQAGFSEMLARHALLDWRKVGYWPGVPRSDQFFVPKHLQRFPTLHVRITWRDSDGNSISVPGPIVIGGGRFFGLGLFAAEQANQPIDSVKRARIGQGCPKETAG